MSKQGHLVYILAIAAITLAVYSGSFNNGFVYDDYPFLVDNPAVRTLNPKAVLANFTDWKAISSDPGLARDVWRPLVVTSFAIDYSIWGLDSRPYHVENTLLHIGCAVLVYLAALLIIGDGFAAFIAAVVFAIHPVQTEAVSWVSGRANVLFLLFFLAAFIFHILRRKGRGTALDYGLCLIFFTLGLLSKEMTIVLPLVCILYDVYFTDERRPRAFLGYYFPFFLIAAFYLMARFSILGAIAQKGQWWGGGLLANLLVTARAVAEYIRLLFLPVNLRVEYVFDIPPVSWHAGLAPAVFAAISAAAVYLLFRRKKEVSFYIAWFFVTLIPVYNIVPFKAVMAERFLYLPLIGFASIFGIAFAALARGRKMRMPYRVALALALSAVIAAYGALTASRNSEWQDEVSFYMKGALRSPESPRAHYNFGYVCVKEAERLRDNGDHAKVYYAVAIGEYEKALALKPDSRVAYAALGSAYSAIGRYDRAILNFRKALAFREDSDVYNNLGVAYYHTGEYGRAEEAFRTALRLDPSHFNSWINLGNAYYTRNEFLKAKRAWLQAGSLCGTSAILEEKLAELTKKGH